jgi:electron transport complex protein RnfC
VKTFRIGGVHPAENKLSAASAIEVLGLPKQAVYPLSQHIGAPAVPCVAKGDVVKVGTKIADAGGFVSASIFSGVSGKVAKIDSVIDASGYRKPAIFIDVEGDEWMEGIDTSDTLVADITLSREEIINRVKDHGIVGLGGATFPTSVKLSIPKDKKAEFVLINAAECEPYITSDTRTMLERGEDIKTGLETILKFINVGKVIFAIEKKI